MNLNLKSEEDTSAYKHFLPACCSAAGMAYAGPMPITSGGTPTTALALRTPSTGRPSASTADLRPIRTAAAPSLTWLELPETNEHVSS